MAGIADVRRLLSYWSVFVGSFVSVCRRYELTIDLRSLECSAGPADCRVSNLDKLLPSSDWRKSTAPTGTTLLFCFYVVAPEHVEESAFFKLTAKAPKPACSPSFAKKRSAPNLPKSNCMNCFYTRIRSIDRAFEWVIQALLHRLRHQRLLKILVDDTV
jgi:hypothetical protein